MERVPPNLQVYHEVNWESTCITNLEAAQLVQKHLAIKFLFQITEFSVNVIKSDSKPFF